MGLQLAVILCHILLFYTIVSYQPPKWAPYASFKAGDDPCM